MSLRTKKRIAAWRPQALNKLRVSSILFIVISDDSSYYLTSSAVSFDAFRVSIRVTSSKRLTFDSCNNLKILSSSSLISVFALEIF
jgi:hypothetical protein